MMGARRAAWNALTAWLRAGPAKGRLGGRKRPFPPPGLEGREAAFARRLAEGTVRRFGSLEAVLGKLARKGRPRPEGLFAALLLGAHELLFERAAPHAAVSEAVELARLAAGKGGAGFANALLRRLAREPELRLWLEEPGPGAPVGTLAAWHSLPPPLVERWLEAFGGERARALFECANLSPHQGLRVRRGRIEAEALGECLASEGFETSPGPHPGTLVLPAGTGRGSLLGTRAFAEGLFSLQDPASTEIADTLQAEPGHRVLDLCAAPGGKTLAIAERLDGKGAVYAYDKSPARLEGLPREAARLGLDGILVLAGEEGLAELRVAAPFDRILVDAPCTNTGVLARRAEARWRFSASFLRAQTETQRRLLEQALSLLAPGGRCVYATCSLEIEENEDLARALVLPPDVELLSAERLLPEPSLRDGSGIAIFRKS